MSPITMSDDGIFSGRVLARYYSRFILLLLGVLPSALIAYLYFFQSPDLKFSNHLFHEVAIAVSIALGGFIAWVSWRCYVESGEVFLQWLTLGFFSFTVVYAFHGLFTRLADHNLWQFILFGPASRLVMALCFLVGLLNYNCEVHPPEQRRAAVAWRRWTAYCLAISTVTFFIASTSLAPAFRLFVEVAALGLFLLSAGLIFVRRQRSGLLLLLTVSLFFFAQSCVAFLIGKAWDHQWWLAHAIFATGFIGLSFGVLKAYLTTRSFSQVFSQEQLMEQIREEKARTEEAYLNLHTAHAQLRTSNTLLQNVFQAATAFSIIATDPRGVITMFSRGAEKMLGYKATEIVGIATPEIIHVAEEVIQRAHELKDIFSHPVEGFRVFVEVPERDGMECRNWTYVHKDGHRIPVSLVVSPMRDELGEITGYLGIAEDISERQKLEQAKRDFMATMTHELRTPLTAIAGAIDLSMSGKLGAPPEPVAELLGIAQRNSHRLTRLINDFLDIEKISAGKLSLDMQWHSITELIEQAVEANRTYSSRRQVSIVLSGTQALKCEVYADSLRVEQVLANLLSNAVKFSEEGGVVEVETFSRNGKLRVVVIDHGPGIPADFQKSVFTKYSQAGRYQIGGVKGSGLGLAISRELIEYMGGAIGFDTVEGKGSQFWFELQARPVIAESRPA